MIVRGKVTKITNFGVFVELEPDLEGLLHISELADHKVEDPHDEVKIGQDIEVKILRVDNEDRKIGLSRKRAQWAAEAEEGGEAPAGRVKPRRGGLHGPGDVGSELIDEVAFVREGKLETRRFDTYGHEMSKDEAAQPDEGPGADQPDDAAAGPEVKDEAEQTESPADEAAPEQTQSDEAAVPEQTESPAGDGDREETPR